MPASRKRDVPVAVTAGSVSCMPWSATSTNAVSSNTPAPLDRVEDLADARVGVAHRRLGDLGVRSALVERGVGEREVAPHEPRERVRLTSRYWPLQMPTACSTPMWSTTDDHE